MPAGKRDVWIVIAGQFVSVIGDNLASIAVLWWVLQTTGSAGWMGGVAAVSAGAAVATSPFAGVIADRLDRRRLMMAVDVIRALLYGGMAVLAAAGHLPLWGVFVLLALARAVGTLFSPALDAALPRMVSSAGLERANGLLGIAQNGGSILGAAAGGVLVAAFGSGVALGADALSFLLSVASLALVAIPGVVAGAGAREAFFAQMRSGMAFIARDGVVRSIIEFALVANALAGAVAVLFPLLAAGPLHAGAQGYGALEAAFPAGMVAGLAAVSARPGLARRGTTLYLAATGVGAALVGLALVHSLVPALACALAGGVLLAVPNVAFPTLLQRRVPPDMQGRVFSLAGGLGQGLVPVAQAVAGLAAQAFTVTVVTLGGGIGVAGASAGFGAVTAGAVDAALAVPAAAPGPTAD